MKYFITFIFFLSLSFIGFSQTQKIKEKSKFDKRHKNPKPTIFDKNLRIGEVNTINFSYKKYGLLTIENLKEELLKYDDKIDSIDYNEQLLTFSFTYNYLMQKEDLIMEFEKFGINYLVKKDTITPNLANE
ncbi:hypothetical protein FRY74_04215 [Vicingus serpentipes]|uniref:Uncharacterized protein n=1 Tax=Vicingus serpentipes TaxID=1926625 RepID=A0A5C6RU00_9FLAO|nr:hypothetical protein [Vicingus serpentipes]TXB65778.1 hypothetical protein FRY74_04215 [Vicingus serpentipes]